MYDSRMLRVIVLALLVSVAPAFAQWSAEDLESDARRLDERYAQRMDSTLKDRDMLAQIHDAIWHGAYKDLTAARSKYDAKKAVYKKSLKSGNLTQARKDLDVVEEVGKDVGERLSVYVHSSEEGKEKIMIVLGVGLFVLAGGGFWIFKRLKKR